MLWLHFLFQLMGIVGTVLKLPSLEWFASLKWHFWNHNTRVLSIDLPMQILWRCGHAQFLLKDGKWVPKCICSKVEKYPCILLLDLLFTSSHSVIRLFLVSKTLFRSLPFPDTASCFVLFSCGPSLSNSTWIHWFIPKYCWLLLS